MPRFFLIVTTGGMLSVTTPAMAQRAANPAPEAVSGDPQKRQAVPGAQTDAKTGESTDDDITAAGELFGDMGGLRPALKRYGVTVGLTETSEAFGNLSGGVRQGFEYEGLTQASVNVDAEKALGLTGGTFYASGLQIHGRGLSRSHLDNNINTISSAEARPGTLLFELWYEQQVIDKRLAVRAGQMAVDQEFDISQYAGLFTNSTFGWPALSGTDLPSGGNAYPLATPGIRVAYTPIDNLNLLAGVFNGDPAGHGDRFAQYRDRLGADFRVRDGALAITEMQYSINQAKDAAGLPGTYKIGSWYNTKSFADQRQNDLGQSIADPAAATPDARSHHGDWSFYAVADQLLYREAKTVDNGLGIFARAAIAPTDRNLVSAYGDAGVTYKGLFPARDDDTLGLAGSISHISHKASDLDSEAAAFGGAPAPVRRNEAALELTYQAAIRPWWQLQPDAQYIIRPNGGVADPVDATSREGNAFVIGLRTVITF